MTDQFTTFDTSTLYIVCHGPQSEWIICDTFLGALKIRDIRIRQNPTLTREDIHIRTLAPIISKRDINNPKRVDHLMTFERHYLWLQERENANS